MRTHFVVFAVSVSAVLALAGCSAAQDQSDPSASPTASASASTDSTVVAEPSPAALATTATPICDWLLATLQTINYKDAVAPASFVGARSDDESGVIVTSCQITPTTDAVTNRDGTVWLSVTKERPLPDGDVTSFKVGYPGVVAASGNVYANADGYQLSLQFLLDPNDKTIAASDNDGAVVKSMMNDLLIRWSSGDRPTTPAS